MRSWMIMINPLFVSEFLIENKASLNHSPAFWATASNLKKFVFCLSLGAKNFLMMNFSKNHNLLTLFSLMILDD